MSKKIENLNKEIMNKIHQNKIKMKPKYYFVIGSFITFVGLLSAVVVTMLSTSMIIFLFKAKGPGAGFRFQMMLENFPVWLIILSATSLAFGIWIFKKYNFTYKLDFRISTVLFVLIIILSSLVINSLGFNDLFMKRGPMKGTMQKYLNSDSKIEHMPGSGWGKQFKN
jgi:hypothetical protein